MKSFVCLASLLVAAIASIHAQPDSTSLPDVIRGDAKMALDGAVHVFTSPSRWDCGDWGRTYGALGLTVGSSVFDTDIRVAIRPTSDRMTRLADAARIYGEGLFVVGVTAGAYGAGLIIKDRWLRETAVLAGTAIVVSTVVTRVLKPVVGRARPYVNTGSSTFHMFSMKDEYNSFPSGHTIAAFSLSSVLAARINNPFATIGLYGLASLTAISRVYTDEHWFSDVVFAGFFASAVGRSLVTWHDEADSPQQGLSVMPGPGQVSVVYWF
jgi:membrane-associated phospholipid phosphatase